jgi:hypothetical protein
MIDKNLVIYNESEKKIIVVDESQRYKDHLNLLNTFIELNPISAVDSCIENLAYKFDDTFRNKKFVLLK